MYFLTIDVIHTIRERDYDLDFEFYPMLIG